MKELLQKFFRPSFSYWDLVGSSVFWFATLRVNIWWCTLIFTILWVMWLLVGEGIRQSKYVDDEE